MTSKTSLGATRTAIGDAHHDVDVLVIGGGPAGTWAACTAAAGGASVVLADKGYCGSSGATAPSGTGVWYVSPDPAKRDAAMASREAMGGFLADRAWMKRVLDRTHDNIDLLAERGYPFPLDDQGVSRRDSLQGPEYMRLMRRRVKEAGARILDHSPALELLVDEDGAVAGAIGIRRQEGTRWSVHAKAVVLATGGCAFLSKALGTNVLTGDGYLMAAEAGADLSGMEFSNAFAISPIFSTVTKTRFYQWGTFFYEDGSIIPEATSRRRSIIAEALMKGPVFAQLDRAGINPFAQRFPVTLRLEGTVRGTGGLRITDKSCATSVPGLYAAGDAATRELICGGFTGGGSHNAAWAMSSGYWAGEAAADYSRQLVQSSARRLRPAGGAALAGGRERAFDPDAVVKAVQDEVFPYAKNYFRSGDALTESLGKLDATWTKLRNADAASAEHVVRAREAAAMTATARWMYRSALTRTETRGMHKRSDHPSQESAQRHYLTVGGLDEVWVARRAAPALERKEVAA